MSDKDREEAMSELSELVTQKKVWGALDPHEQRKLSALLSVAQGNRDPDELGGDGRSGPEKESEVRGNERAHSVQWYAFDDTIGVTCQNTGESTRIDPHKVSYCPYCAANISSLI